VAFLDTSVLLSYAFESDGNHPVAKRILEDMVREGRPLFVSPLTILEVYLVSTRMIASGSVQLPGALERNLNRLQSEKKIGRVATLLIPFLVERLRLRVCSDGEVPGLRQLERADFLDRRFMRLYLAAMKKAQFVRLKSLDMLHLVYVCALSQRGYPKAFVTFDQGFKDFSDVIEREFGIKVFTDETPQ